MTDEMTPLDALELVRDTASQEWQSADGKRHAAVGNDGERFWFITENLMRAIRSLLASQAKQAVQPPEFQEVSWGVDSVMRPCKSMAISEHAFRRWAETNGIALALPAPIEQITPENTDGVRVSDDTEPAPETCHVCQQMNGFHQRGCSTLDGVPGTPETKENDRG